MLQDYSKLLSCTGHGKPILPSERQHFGEGKKSRSRGVCCRQCCQRAVLSVQDAEEDVEAAQQHLQAAEAHAREAADLVAGMGDSEAVSAEYAEGIAQNEAAASAAVTEAQQQVLPPAQSDG